MVKIIVVSTLVILFFFTLAAVGYWFWLDNIDPNTIRLIAYCAVLALLAGVALAPVILYVGFYFGKTEARGMLAGVDKTLEKGFGLMQSTVAVRDNSRINVSNALKPEGRGGINGPVLVYPRLEEFSGNGENDRGPIDM